MKIAGVREALEASKFAIIQLIINPLIGRPSNTGGTTRKIAK